jgi:choline dehydrogenase-like flavoprotein
MQVTRLETLEDAGSIAADVCLVGGGPAALTVARELANEPMRIVLIESGGQVADIELDARSQGEIENVGKLQTRIRNRVVGGSSHTWAGRCTELDPIDFEARDWVPFSGWPIGLGDLQRYGERACAHLGIAPFRNDAHLWPRLTPRRPEPDVDEALLSPFFWQHSRDASDPLDAKRFGPAFLASRQSNVRLLLHAMATHINTTADGAAVTGVEIADRRGRRFTLEAPSVVLACGGIENPRLLLASRRITPTGIGNSHGLVGRFLMDHPHYTIGDFDLATIDALRDRFGYYHLGRSGQVVRHGLALSPTLQRRERLLNCVAWLHEFRAEDDPWDAIKRLRRPGPDGRRLADLRAAWAHPGLVARGAYRRVFAGRALVHKLDRLGLNAMVEQAPDPESRVILSDRTDSFGVPLPRINWRIGEMEMRSVARLGQLIARELSRLGLPAPRLMDWVVARQYHLADFSDHGHPSGTTRMAANPSIGVVDPHCEVYGVRGLYVAGSSVFPTVGHANPTMMILMLAVRLADQIRRRLNAKPAVRSHAAAMRAAWPGPASHDQAKPLVARPGPQYQYSSENRLDVLGLGLAANRVEET